MVERPMGSTAKAEPDLPNYRAKSFYGKNKSGQYIYVYSDQANRRGLFYKTRSLGGNWSDAHTFYHHDNRNSYPTLIEHKSGKWLAVWDSSNHPDQRRTVIRFGRLAPSTTETPQR
ncbi:MAG: hypothetical protein VB878_20580 [Pirellulaceae bacterium]